MSGRGGWCYPPSMAIKTHTTKKTVVQESTHTLVVCDGCGAESDDGRWNPQNFEHDSVKLSLRHKTYYPEGGGFRGITFDCCPKCFREKVQPAIEALGFKTREIDSDY